MYMVVKKPNDQQYTCRKAITGRLIGNHDQDSDDSQKIWSRIKRARPAFNQMAKLFTSHSQSTVT